MESILVTGSSGMIGTALVKRLSKEGYKVYGVDKKEPLVSSENFIKHNLLRALHHPNDIDLVIHLAANARVEKLVKNPRLAFENIGSTYNVLEYARVAKIPVLFASSREVYGNDITLPVAEGVGSQRTSESPYSTSKLAGESYCWSYNRCYGMNNKIMRFSNVYGKYDFSNRFIPLALKKLKQGKEFTIYGKDKLLDFTYLDDCVDGILLLVKNWNNLKYVEYNIASGKDSSLIEVVDMLKQHLDSKSKIIIEPTRLGEVTKYQADISRMKELGYEPKTSINEGIKKSIQYYA